jgi:hypothetical protein
MTDAQTLAGLVALFLIKPEPKMVKIFGRFLNTAKQGRSANPQKKYKVRD